MTINNMENALALYEQAATYFTDREWKARALFMGILLYNGPLCPKLVG